MDITYKTAIVTGASSGIGREICLCLLDSGARVVNISRRGEDKTGKVSVSKLGVIYERCDVCEEVDKLEAIISEYAPDILVNNVGILDLIGLDDLSHDDYERTMGTNLKSAVFATKAALVSMTKKGGSIVNISSIDGIKGDSDAPIYGASKAALINFTKSVAKRYGNLVRCNCICPGVVDTLLVENDAEFIISETKKITTGRFAKPEEIAQLVVDIISNDYLNGSVIVVDGGRLLW